MQHMKCEWKAPPEQRNRKKEKCSANCAELGELLAKAQEEEGGDISWTIAGCNHGDIKIMPRSKHWAVNGYAPSHPSPDDAGIALDTRRQLPQLRKEHRTTPAHEKKAGAAYAIACFFPPRVCRRTAPLKYKASRVHRGMSACRNTRKKKLYMYTWVLQGSCTADQQTL